MSDTWGLRVLMDHIGQMENDNKKRLLLDIARSIDRSVSIFRYHIYAAHGALNDFKNDEVDKFRLILGISEHQDKYEYARIISEANFVAGIHVVRNMYDIFAQLLNGLVVSPTLQIHSCNIGKVHERLPSSPLKEHIGSLRASYWFRYIEAFSNISKHRQLIPYRQQVTMAEGRFEPHISEFKYGSETYKEYWLTEVLEGIIEAQNNILECGRSLNSQLGLDP